MKSTSFCLAVFVSLAAAVSGSPIASYRKYDESYLGPKFNVAPLEKDGDQYIAKIDVGEYNTHRYVYQHEYWDVKNATVVVDTAGFVTVVKAKPYQNPSVWSNVSLTSNGDNFVKVDIKDESVNFYGHKVRAEVGRTPENIAHGTLGLGQIKTGPSVKSSLLSGFQADNTNHVSYSLYLGDNDGQLIIGGIDTSKYEGDLTYLPFHANQDASNKFVSKSFSDISSETDEHFYVDVDKVQLGSESMSSRPYQAVFASAVNKLAVPTDVYKKIKAANSQVGSQISCQFEGENLEFTFQNSTISTRLSDYIISVEDKCFLSVEDSGSDTFVLGTPFLRSAYINVDIAGGTVGVAPSSNGDAEVKIEVYSG